MAPLKLSLKDTLRIIKLYKENPCLYKTDHENYDDLSARRSALESIRDSMGIPNATVEEIKRKLKSLRSTFMQEYKKVKKAQESGHSYIPKLKWYELFTFVLNNRSTEEYIGSVSTFSAFLLCFFFCSCKYINVAFHR